MTRSIDELFGEIVAGAPAAQGAVDEIAARGAAALPDLCRIIVSGRGRFIATALLSALEVPDRVALLAPLASDVDPDLQEAGIAALATTGDPRAVPVIEQAGRDGELQAIRALGDLGAPDGLAALRRLVEHRIGDLARPGALAELMKPAIEDSDPSDVFVGAESAESLAKLGDVSGRAFACELAALPASAFGDADSFRLSAIHALDIMIGPGIADVLDRASDDANPEIADAAMSAALHLGRIRAVDRWLAIAAREDRRATAALWCIDELVGEPPPQDARRSASWWNGLRTRFDPAVCYRRGAPATPRTLVAAVRDRDARTIRRELRQMTGLPFVTPALDPPSSAELRAIDEWWRTHATSFSPGQLHRWGRAYETSACD